jgi:transcriptional regulator with XRE-family HTH domain
VTPADLKSARQALGWSQSRLAEALGYGPRHVQKLEAGESPIRKPVAMAIEFWLAAIAKSGPHDGFPVKEV